jgi:hypothetical protein
MRFPKNGNNNKISTSKIRKINATKKNRKEKGNRLSSLVENPHSKGLFISRSINTFFLIACVANTKTTASKNLTTLNKINTNIYNILLYGLNSYFFEKEQTHL